MEFAFGESGYSLWHATLLADVLVFLKGNTISFSPSFKVEKGKAACIVGQCLSSVRVHSPKNLCFPSSLPQLFIFIQRKISSEEEAIMAEVHRYRDDQR